MSDHTGPEKPQSPLREITQPFIDLVHAPRALWGINLAYVIEGMVYFGMLGYLALYFADVIFQRDEHAGEWSHMMVAVLTGGITLAMAVLGFVADKRGVRFALILAFIFMLAGRCLWSGAPNVLGLEPTRPGVMAGDKISLHVTEISTVDGVKAITKASLIANNEAGRGLRDTFAVDLAAGGGIEPSQELESRLVRLSKATVVEGAEQVWKVEYGTAPIKATLFANAADQVGLCVGAVITLEDAYVGYWKEKELWVIRSHWAEDFGEVDTSHCTDEAKLKAKQAKNNATNVEPMLKSHERWPVSAEPKTASPPATVGIPELRDLKDGRVNVDLDDVEVTYVRNGGYFLQSKPDGEAIYASVSPYWSALHLVTIAGMLLVVIGYGMYQPAAYAAVRQFTTPKTAAMGFAMLYALMNLGGWFPTFAFLLRDDDYLGLGYSGTFWVYTGFTVFALLTTIIILSAATVRKATASAKEETARIKAEASAAAGITKQKDGATSSGTNARAENEPLRIKPHMWLFWLMAIGMLLFKGEAPWFCSWQEVVQGWAQSGFLCGAVIRWSIAALVFISPVVFATVPPAHRWLARYPLSDGKFAFFIFALIPVQTLFTYNWLVLPAYINRAFAGWIGEYFEIASNANPILIFIAVPIITAISQKAKVYNMMIVGTFVMATPAFLLVIGPHWWTLAAYLLIMTIGEAMWQPRFLQYAAEIAPEGRTGEYMGVAQFPWFLTKVLVPILYSGRMMDRYCPADGPKNTEFMWFIFGCIAIMSTVLLILAKGWLGKDFKTKAD